MNNTKEKPPLWVDVVRGIIITVAIIILVVVSAALVEAWGRGIAEVVFGMFLFVMMVTIFTYIVRSRR